MRSWVCTPRCNGQTSLHCPSEKQPKTDLKWPVFGCERDRYIKPTTQKKKPANPVIVRACEPFGVVPVAGVEPARYCYQRILSYLLHTEHRRTQPPVEVVAGHLKALQILRFLKLMCKKLRFVCHFRSFRFGRKFWILEGHRRDVTHKRSTTAHAIDSSIENTL